MSGGRRLLVGIPTPHSRYPHSINADPALPRNNTKLQPGLHHHAHLPSQTGIILDIRHHHVRCHCMHFSGRITIVHGICCWDILMKHRPLQTCDRPRNGR